MAKYRCITPHQTPVFPGGFRTFEKGREYSDDEIPPGSREWTEEGPGDPSPAYFCRVGTAHQDASIDMAG